MSFNNDKPGVLNTPREQSLPLPRSAEAFTVKDERTANWVIKKILEHRAYRKRVSEWAETEQARAQRTEDFLLNRFGAELREWLQQALVQRRSRQKSINLPAGRLGLRRKEQRLVVKDQKALVDWAKAHAPHLVRTLETVSKQALNEHFLESGELAPGVSLEPAGDCLYVR